MVGSGAGRLVCCGQPMELLTEISEGEGWEKHLPRVERANGTIRVYIGSEPHPMGEDHYIAWVEVLTGSHVMRAELGSGAEPKAEFPDLGGAIKVRSLCNKHGLRAVEVL